MIKTILSGSFDFGMPSVSLVEVWSRGLDQGWMRKRAAVLTKEIGDIKPEPGHQFIHLISMGAMDHYGANRNGDGFNEKRATFEFPFPGKGVPKSVELGGGLIQYHPTFLKHAKVYRHHKNDNPELSIGDVVAEAYNPEMKRGELIIKVPENDEWMAHLEKLASGGDLAFSMSCRVPYDICSTCGNRAKNRAEYCDHLKNHMTEITKTGHQVFAINDEPTFFDISRVFKPADRIAFSLRKVASCEVKSGAQIAEELGVKIPDRVFEDLAPKMAAKLAAARKFAAIEKEIDSLASGGNNSHLKSMLPACPCGSLPAGAMEALRDVKLGTALRGLADAKICLSLEDFIKLVMGEKADSLASEVTGLRSALPGMFGRLLDSGEAEECAANDSYDSPNTAIPQRLKEVLRSVSNAFSMDDNPVQGRMKITIIRGTIPGLGRIKSAAVSASKSHLLTEYAAYQLSFAQSAGDDELVHGLTVLRNHAGP